MTQHDTPQNSESKRVGFEALGFRGPETLAYLDRNFSSAEALKDKISALRTRGVPYPEGAIKKHPALASLDINRAFDQLEANGIVNAGEAIQKYPQLADLIIKDVIDSWHDAGVKNPAKAISTYPPMAGRNPAIVIQGLHDAGLKNPGATISKYPPLSCLSTKRVAQRVRIAPFFNRTHEPDYDPIAFLEQNPQLFGYHIHRIFFFLRIASHFSLESNNAVALLKKNPYLILHVLSRTIPDSNARLMREAHAITKIKKSEKDIIIKETREALPESIELLKEQILTESDDEKIKHARLCLSLAHTLMHLERSKHSKEEPGDSAI